MSVSCMVEWQYLYRQLTSLNVNYTYVAGLIYVASFWQNLDIKLCLLKIYWYIVYVYIYVCRDGTGGLEVQSVGSYDDHLILCGRTGAHRCHRLVVTELEANSQSILPSITAMHILLLVRFQMAPVLTWNKISAHRFHQQAYRTQANLYQPPRCSIWEHS
jgi:hypothetical protein